MVCERITSANIGNFALAAIILSGMSSDASAPNTFHRLRILFHQLWMFFLISENISPTPLIIQFLYLILRLGIQIGIMNLFDHKTAVGPECISCIAPYQLVGQLLGIQVIA